MMTINPSLGHLYHDQTMSNISTVLDAQEQLRTRQRNAREQRQLGKYNLTLDKAKTICIRRHEWEETEMKNELESIKTRTPSLDNGLRQESQRVRRRHDNFSDRRSKSAVTFSSKNTNSQSVTSSRINTAFTCKSSATSSKKDVWSNVDSKERMSSDFTASRSSISRDQTNSRSHSSFIKKAENVTRALHKLYRRQKERASADKELMELVKSDNRELLLKARVFFKGTEAAHILEKILATNNTVDRESEVFSTESVDNFPEQHLDVPLNPNNERFTSGSDELSRDAFNNEIKALTTDKKDDEKMMSTYVNPSVPGDRGANTQAKWTDIFSSPELWKLYLEKQKLANIKQERKRSLVTITARYRRTLVR